MFSFITPGLILGLVVGFAILMVFLNSFVMVGGSEQVVLERRWFGKKIPQGRIIALSNEVGVQARVLTPGFHLLIPFIYKYKREPLFNIGEDEVGLVESIDGGNVPAGRIFADMVEGHNSFQDGEAFLRNGGQKGMQVPVIPSGEYRINTTLFKVTKAQIVVIPQGKLGIVTAQDGKKIPEGRLFAPSVPGHSNFESGGEFLKNGYRGVQLDIIKPGTYRINLNLFEVTIVDAVVIPNDFIGIVTANDGEKLAENEFVAPSVLGHMDYENGDSFIKSGGKKGVQQDVLRPGTYYINPRMFSVKKEPVTEIKPGQVGVVVSNVGLEPTAEMKRRMTSTQDVSSPDFVNNGQETCVVPNGYRGIQEDVLAPKSYYLNKFASIVTMVNTTNITIDWADDTPNGFNRLLITSQDGFEIKVSVKAIIRVRPDQAPHMVAKIGSIENLINNVMHPLIDSSFRNQASITPAMSFMQKRTDEQVKAQEHARKELEPYHVDCVNILICDIELPKELTETQTKRIISEQQQQMYSMEEKSQAERASMEKTKAKADQQPQLVKSEIDVQIAEQRRKEKTIIAEAEAAVAKQQGQGQKDKLSLEGEGEAAKITSIGEAKASAYKSQSDAMGQDNIVRIKLAEIVSDAIKEGKIKLVPDVLVQGGNDTGAAQGMFATLAKSIPGIGDLLSNYNSKSALSAAGAMGAETSRMATGKKSYENKNDLNHSSDRDEQV